MDDVVFDTSEPEADTGEASDAATDEDDKINPVDLAELPELSEKDYEALFS